MKLSAKEIKKAAAQQAAVRKSESFYRYVADCKSGIDTVVAWKAHKARMAVEGITVGIKGGAR